MASLLILEDDPQDMRAASEAAAQAGFSATQVLTSPEQAAVLLGNQIEDGQSFPDAMVIDLDLGQESGFELLRFCHKNHLMARIQVVVWTVLGDPQREICRLFGVQEFVSKHDGPEALLEVLMRLNQKDRAGG